MWSSSSYKIGEKNDSKKARTFAMTSAKLYVPVVTLSIQNNAKLLQQLKSGFKRKINWNKHKSKKSKEVKNWYLDKLISPSFQRVNRLFVLSFEKENGRLWHTGY